MSELMARAVYADGYRTPLVALTVNNEFTFGCVRDGEEVA